MKKILVAITAFALLSCGSEHQEYQPVQINLAEEEAEILNAIASTQQLLIQNLMAHVDSTDLEPAVRFCAENAQHLTDSISKELGYHIHRLSAKNRNIRNEMNQLDWKAYRHFEQTKSDGSMATSYFDEVNQTYYSPIVLGMPLCLKCHGDAQSRDEKAYAIIQEIYPRDLAIDYQLGEIRGVWQVRKRH